MSATRREFMLAISLLPACSGPFSTEATRASERRNLETDVDATLERCYLIDPDTRKQVASAVGVLVFPTVAPVDPVTGEWAGMGVLRVGAVFTTSYFLSIPAGMARQSKVRSIIFLFTHLDALNTLRRSKPWRAGTSMPDVLTLVLQGNVLITSPAMPDMVVVPLDTTTGLARQLPQRVA
jgi:hypothetical protein